MDSRFVWTSVALAAVVMVSVVAVNIASSREALLESHEQVSDIEIMESVPEAPSPEGYLLKIHNGKIGIFIKGNTAPEYYLEVPIRQLPEFDRGQLEQGVQAETPEVLFALIEDYSS